MSDIRIHSVEFESGQEPQDLFDDDFATSFDAEFTLGGRALAQMLGVQMRVLDQHLAKLDGRKAVQRFQKSDRIMDMVTQAVTPQIKRTMASLAADLGADGVKITAIEFHTDSQYWEGKVDARKGEVKIMGQINVLGDWGSSGGRYAAGSPEDAMSRRLGSRWAAEKRAGDVGQTILKQMGGSGRLKAMIGAKDFLVGHKEKGALGGLSFKFPRPGTGKPNFLKILLMPDDTYTVEFGSISGYNYKVLKTYTDIYWDQLKSLFERTTGLYLSL